MSTPLEEQIAANLATVRERIAVAARSADRDPIEVTLIAVSKGQPMERIQAALAAGHRVFGENRVQEAEAHWSDLRGQYSDLCLHMVGPLQTNKTRDAVVLFDVVQTVDREKLAQKLAAARGASSQVRQYFIEVNTGEEPQKAGVWPEDADAFIAHCVSELALPVVGLMCIPPADEEPALHFTLLREIAMRNGLGQLSMGMSADYETAVALGATHVRVGTGIFGPRIARTGT